MPPPVLPSQSGPPALVRWPPGGLRTAEMRGMVPPMYGDREVAEAADSLVAAGLLGSRM